MTEKKEEEKTTQIRCKLTHIYIPAQASNTVDCNTWLQRTAATTITAMSLGLGGEGAANKRSPFCQNLLWRCSSVHKYPILSQKKKKKESLKKKSTTTIPKIQYMNDDSNSLYACNCITWLTYSDKMSNIIFAKFLCLRREKKERGKKKKKTVKNMGK